MVRSGAVKVSISFDPDHLAAVDWLRGATSPSGQPGGPALGNGKRSGVVQELIEREMRVRFGPNWQEALRARIAAEAPAPVAPSPLRKVG